MGAYSKKILISVGGGKGGIGKSFITANLGIVLASNSFGTTSKVLLVDSDLGSSNLNTFLGIPIPRHTINDFLQNQDSQIDDVIEPTPFPGVDIICGDNDILNLANLPFNKKMRLMKGLKKLDADFILFDLAAGSDFKTLDLFNQSDIKIVVTTPEPISVQNAYGFIKNALFRRIISKVSTNEEIKKLTNAYINRKLNNVKDVHILIEKINNIDSNCASRIRKIINNFNPKLILNMVHKRYDKGIGDKLVEVVQHYIGVRMEVLGWIPYDLRIRDSVREGETFLPNYVKSRPSAHLYSIANILHKIPVGSNNDSETSE